MRLLQDRFILIAPDLRGFGTSDKPDGPWSSYDHASDLLAVLHAMGMERVGVVGHHIGGSVMQPLARQAPERLSGVAGWPAGPGVVQKLPLLGNTGSR